MLLKQAWAHSQNKAGQAQGLKPHLDGVAALARLFATKFGAGDLAYRAGLLHDIGKVLDEWQVFVRGGDGEEKSDHRAAGAVRAHQDRRPDVSFIVHGHHGGLTSKADLLGWLQEKSQEPHVQRVVTVIDELIPELNQAGPAAVPTFLKDALDWEFFIRMLYSALVDADWLDTEAHFSPLKRRVRRESYVQPKLDLMFAKLRGKVQDMSLDGPINQYRRGVWKSCLQSASLPRGFYRLTVPTGGGKTFSSLGFGLLHALTHQLDRVIVGIPYTSIIEQTADVYRSVLGEDAVLEHHSAVTENGNRQSFTPTWTKLASENWDSRLVVTTTVQLFESLFANQPSKCRKLHNYANSVIILDEVQTLPVELMLPILDGLRQLVANYNVTVVLCTATQPALDQSPYLQGLPGVKEIVPNAKELYTALRRVDYIIVPPDQPWNWQRIAAEMQKTDQCMTVLNTISDSLTVLMLMVKDPSVMYLSTNLCGAHRREVLAEVRRRLKAKEPIRLVTTQVVEAGVDLDFPKVMRAVGPMDRIVQAAGRANREGKMATPGEVIVFTPEAGKLPPGPYMFATHLTGKYLAMPGIDLHDPAVYQRYFQELYRKLRKELDKHNIQDHRKQFDYPRVAELMKLIPQDTVTMVVHYAYPDMPTQDPAADIIAELKASQADGSTWMVMRKLQPYLVQIMKKDLPKYELAELVREIIPGLYEWLGEYHPLFGLVGKHFDE